MDENQCAAVGIHVSLWPASQGRETPLHRGRWHATSSKAAFWWPKADTNRYGDYNTGTGHQLSGVDAGQTIKDFVRHPQSSTSAEHPVQLR
jgi:hypothetical protein